jgi:hypothetical protein
MFPRMKQRLGSALMENLDLLVEFSTLGEYRLGDGPAPAPAPAAKDGPEPGTAQPAGPAPLPSRPLRDGRPDRSAPAPALVPGRVAAATAAGRRARRGVPAVEAAEHGQRQRGAPARPPRPARRQRAGAPAPAEQLCLTGMAERAA